jgi:hypothetical protein
MLKNPFNFSYYLVYSGDRFFTRFLSSSYNSHVCFAKKKIKNKIGLKNQLYNSNAIEIENHYIEGILVFVSLGFGLG